MPELKNPLDASPEEVDGRLKELRETFTKEFSEGRRHADWLSDPGLKSMLEEVNVLDTCVTLMGAEQARSEQRRAVALMGSGRRSEEHLTIGEMLVKSPDLMKYIDGHHKGVIPESAAGGRIIKDGPSQAAGFRAQLTSDGPEIGQFQFSSQCLELELSGDEGRRAMAWSRHASGESGYRVSAGAEEWGSSPPSYDTTGSGNLLPVGQPVPPVPRRARLWLRDLLPSMTTTLAQIPYVQELNPTTYEGASGATGGAQTVAEAGTKPSAQLSFQGQTARPTVVAATLVISKQLFEDSPAVVQYINGRLPYLTRFQEDYQYLQGNGTWPNIPGILNQSGIQSQSYTSIGGTANDRAQTIALSMALVEDHDGSPNAVVMYPDDAWKMFANRAAGGSGTFDAGTPFSALPLTVWGVQSYRSRAYPALQALVGDFQLGGMIVDREQVNVQLYRERYAEQNLILLICEERTGVMWFRPDLFVSTLLH